MGAYEVKYPPSSEDFLKSDDEILDKIWNDLTEFDVLPILNAEKKRYSECTTRDEKITSIIRTIERLFSLPNDGYTSTREQAVELALNDNIRMRNKRRRDDDDSSEDSMDTNDSVDSVDDRHVQRRRLEGGTIFQKYYL